MEPTNGQAAVASPVVSALPNTQPADFAATVAAVLAVLQQGGIANANATAPAAAWLHEGTAARKSAKASKATAPAQHSITRTVERTSFEGHPGYKVTKVIDGRPARWKFVMDADLDAIDKHRGRK